MFNSFKNKYFKKSIDNNNIYYSQTDSCFILSNDSKNLASLQLVNNKKLDSLNIITDNFFEISNNEIFNKIIITNLNNSNKLNMIDILKLTINIYKNNILYTNKNIILLPYESLSLKLSSNIIEDHFTIKINIDSMYSNELILSWDKINCFNINKIKKMVPVNFNSLNIRNNCNRKIFEHHKLLNEW